MDRIFVEWIYTRVMMYKEVTIVDTSFHKIMYKEKEITHGEAIDKILELAKECLMHTDIDDEQLWYDNTREICDLWKEILPYMWW
jgi:hypothetical protein